MVQAVDEGICRYEGHTLLVATLNTKLVLLLTGGRRIYRSCERTIESLAVCRYQLCVCFCNDHQACKQTSLASY